MAIIANMATYPPRRESMIAAARGIAPQVALLNVILNNYSSQIEELESFSNIRQYLPAHDTKDTGKFYPTIASADYVLLVDDDIDYPGDLVQKMLSEMREKGPRSVIGYHGTIYRRPKFSLEPRKLLEWARFDSTRDILLHRKVFPFFRELEETTCVDQLGTGVVLLAAANYPPFEYMSDARFFVDVRFAKWCFENQLKQYAARRSANWLKKKAQSESIYQSFTVAAPAHVRREILSYAFKRPDKKQILRAIK